MRQLLGGGVVHLPVIGAGDCGCRFALGGHVDGQLDIVAGRNWYRNPEWIPRPLRLLEDNNGYARSNGEWAYDVNGDGPHDELSRDFFWSKLYR